MRRGCEGRVLLEEENGGEVIGISLGWDFTSEHEWGIKDIIRNLGIKKDKLGLPRHVISCSENNFHFVQSKNFVLLLHCEPYAMDRVNKITPENLDELVEAGDYPFDYDGLLKRDTKECSTSFAPAKANENPFAAAWSEDDFAILANKNSKAGKFVVRLYNAAKRNDMAVYIGGRVFIGNAGLCLTIASKTPRKVKDEMLKNDKDHAKLLAVAKKISMEDTLKRAGKKYLALSPAWLGKGRSSKYSVMFWLNPCEQQENNSGWFTVEDFDQWIAGKGPIPKNDES